MSKQSGEEDAASVYGYTGTLGANTQGRGIGECVRVYRYTMSKQPGEEDGVSVYGYTGTL